MQGAIERDHTDDERVAIQAAIDALASARPIDCRGPKPRLLTRWLGRS
jgi:hypothetical protein